MTDARPTPAERALAAAMYAPIGLGAKVVDDLPTAVVKVRQQLVFARFIGKIAVDQGVRDLRDRWEHLAHPVPTAAEEAGDTVQQTPSIMPSEGSVDAGVGPNDAPSLDTLALPDYDQLPAAHVVSKLAGLAADELDAVEAYEAAHRHRRTVLGKISQLRGD